MLSWVANADKCPELSATYDAAQSKRAQVCSIVDEGALDYDAQLIACEDAQAEENIAGVEIASCLSPGLGWNLKD